MVTIRGIARFGGRLDEANNRASKGQAIRVYGEDIAAVFGREPEEG